ncbi:hypothetical protein FJTKL_00058 [Diaporthe vaccinii]|uniref:Rhodopsin domain-containing protein n=1 Tax=Diaporthe vaccinii TaxID=105482 RepID=A0ABR4E4K7_9PEZI
MGSDDANLPARLMSDNVRRQSDHAPAQEGSLTLSEHSTLTTAVVLGCLATISVVIAIRLMVKKMMAPHRLSADDFLVLVAAAFTLSFCMVSLGATMHGLGQHSSDLIDAGIDLRHIIEFLWAGHILYSFAIAFAKLSIISSNFRIFPHDRLHKLMYVMLTVTLALLVVSVMATIFICLPIQAAWDPTIRAQAKCYQFPTFLYASTTVNIVTDVVLCTAPLPYFLRLGLPRKQKIGACLLFIVGGSAVFASMVKLTYIHTLYNTSDISFDLAEPVMWSILECSISIVCLSMPSLRPLFAKLAPLVFFAGDHRQPRERSTITSFSDEPPRLVLAQTPSFVSRSISCDSQSPTIRETNTTPDSGRTGGKLVIVEEIVVEPKV